MVGSALTRRLAAEGYSRVMVRTRAEVDLTDQQAVRGLFHRETPDVVFLAAARVGGILANSTYPAEFIYRNLMIEANVIHAAFEAGVDRLLFLGSSCIYPKHAPQPMVEESLMGGYFEPTNAPYALAKISGIMLSDSYNRQYGTHFRAVMPTNLYGVNDSFDLNQSHVLPAMLRKFHLAKLAGRRDWTGIEADLARFGPIPPEVLEGLKKHPPEVVLWGSGRPRREFLNVDDLASACLFIMGIADEDYQAILLSPEAARASLPQGAPSRVTHVNVGCGEDQTVRELADLVRAAVGFEGEILWDGTKPDGMARKLLDVGRLTRLGWRPAVELDRGIAETYRWYLEETRR
jgi:GDP-L-fucose synthase